MSEQEVDVEAALVRLVDDQRVVGAEERIALRLGEQDAVGHQLDAGSRREAVLETNLEADHLAERGLQLLGDPACDGGCGDAARLRVADPATATGAAAPEGQGDLGQLCRLARPGLARDDEHGMSLDRGRDLVPPHRHRQRFGKLDRRQRVGAHGRKRGIPGACRHVVAIIPRGVEGPLGRGFPYLRTGRQHRRVDRFRRPRRAQVHLHPSIQQEPS